MEDLMLSNYERKLITTYLANMAVKLNHRDPAAVGLVNWITDKDNRHLHGVNTIFPHMVSIARYLDDTPTKDQLRMVRQALQSERVALKSTKYDLAAKRLQNLAQATCLSTTDVDILELLLRYSTQPVIEKMIDDIFRERTRYSVMFNLYAIATLLNLSTGDVQRRMHSESPLVRSGLVTIDREDGEVDIVSRLHRLATDSNHKNLDAIRLLLDVAPESELKWEDFEHISKGRDHIERLIAGALQNSALGVNILLYGPPGTGKTEFCKVLAKRLGVTLYSVGESDDEGDEMTRRERQQELRLTQRLLAKSRNSLILFDEMDDLLTNGAGLRFFGMSFSSNSQNGGSKVYMHQLLERSPAPTLWTINDTSSVDRSLLRRMSYALELSPPSMSVRARIWKTQLERYGIEADAEDACALAREFTATPGIAAGATAAASIAGGGIDAVRIGVQSLSRLVSSEVPPEGVPTLFDPTLIQATTCPVKLADNLVKSGVLKFSICLQGPPGTGKSAYVRYLAERMGLEVMQKRTSDLISKWVGDTEKNIAAAFKEAQNTNSFLVFDEADSLLYDRKIAQKSWEVSQVNEMLTWMEVHQLPFACTTNFGEHLDSATLRRFVFKITLDYLQPEQIRSAFQTYFGFAPPERVLNLTNLTPGDFAVVHRKSAIIGQSDNQEALAEMLCAECDAKPGRSVSIGFLA
ncbi:MAG: AAA family ATPase [Gammaproteobacteria bacterium]|nr:AAA family ATPase [Gammaproteobacteria bacterium]